RPPPWTMSRVAKHAPRLRAPAARVAAAAHLSQLELSSRTGVSSRHLSYLETGRSSPSRQMILYLAEHLDIPLRDRNALLLAAEYAPVYSHRALDDSDTDMTYVREAIE